MPAEGKTNQSRALTGAGLIAVTAATLLMMAWAIFATPASASHSEGVTGNPSCKSLGYEFGFKVEPVVNGTFNVPGFGTITISASDGQFFNWSSTFGIDAVIVKGGTKANIFTYSPEAQSGSGLHAPDNASGQPAGLSHIEFCFDEDETTTTTTTTTTTPTTTTTTPTTTTASPTVGPTTIHKSTTTTDTVEVLPTTVTPGGTAFTGIEDVVPIGALALTLLTSGSGLLWAGARRRRQDGSEDED